MLNKTEAQINDALDGKYAGINVGEAIDPTWLGNQLASKLKLKSTGNGINNNRSLLIVDSLGRPLIAINEDGRIDVISHNAYGSIHVLYNTADAAIEQQNGHYAFGGKDNSGQMHTMGLIRNITTDPLNTGIKSRLEFAVMRGSVASGYNQPDVFFIYDGYTLNIKDAWFLSDFGLAIGAENLKRAKIELTSLDSKSIYLVNIQPYEVGIKNEITFLAKTASYGDTTHPHAGMGCEVRGDVMGRLYFWTRNGSGDESIKMTIEADGQIVTTKCNEYADNAAAIAAGLVVGTHYRTGDFLKIVHA